MSAIRIWDRFKNLLDVNWASIADGQFLKRSGTAIIGGTPSGGGTGDVVGPGSSIANEISIYSDATGKLIGRLTPPAGSLVGTTAAQTLTGKTLTSPAISTPTGIVKGDVGLGNCDNTSDANKPVSTAQATADALKIDKSIVTAKGDILVATASATVACKGAGTNGFLLFPNSALADGLEWRAGAKADVGLASVDNTADSAKPVSAAQASADALKEDKANKAVANGYASLDATGKVPSAQLPAGGTGDVVGPASAADSEISLFSGTGGKTIKRATGTGLVNVISGVYQAPIDSQFLTPVGSVVDFAGAVQPAGWLFCYGQSLLRAGAYAVLFGVIGTTYGAVDGTHFSLPDLRGYVTAGKDDMGGTSQNILSVVKTCNNTTAATVTVTSGGNTNDVCIGDLVIGTNIPAGCKIVTIPTATTFTVSPVPTGSNTGALLRIGPINSIIIGAIGGTSAHKLVVAQMPSHLHATNIIQNVGGTVVAAGGLGVWGNVNSTSAGGDNAHPNLQPTYILNKIIYAGV